MTVIDSMVLNATERNTAGRRVPCARACASVLSGLDGEGLPGEMTRGLRAVGSEPKQHPGGRTRRCKGPGVGTCGASEEPWRSRCGGKRMLRAGGGGGCWYWTRRPQVLLAC